MNKFLSFLISAFTIMLFGHCDKEDKWLDKRANLGDVVPQTVEDFQQLLNNDNIMNASYPNLGLISMDNYFISAQDWQIQDIPSRNSYVWAKDIFEGQLSLDWNSTYRIVEYANVVLDGLQKIAVESTSANDYYNVKGSALFYRSMAFYNAVQLFAPQYSETSKDVPGIPIRLTSDVNAKSTRAKLADVYSQITTDLKIAAEMLPVNALKVMRPSKFAVYALLSRVYLMTGQYDSCIAYSSKCLAINNKLIDFNTLNANAARPFPTFRVGNPEVIFNAQCSGATIVSPDGIANVDTFLYRSYDANDLRKVVFYKIYDLTQNRVVFKASYTGATTHFGGIAINEILLNRAESYARVGSAELAMNDVNELLKMRYKINTYVAPSISTAEEALMYILDHRRKELPFTGILRWCDLRRLNLEARFRRTLVRDLGGQVYTLEPNSPRYVFPIPDNEIRLSGLQQNER